MYATSRPETRDTADAKIYWPHLDGLRFIAFVLVFVSHLGPIHAGEPSSLSGFIVGSLNLVSAWGWSGVDLFYVLSGFLITTLLAAERNRFGEIRYWQFFARRTLRIWPLYYWIVLVSCLVLPVWGVWDVFLGTPAWWLMIERYAGWYGVFLGNLPISWHEAAGITPLLGVMWSVCMEEQFYLTWGGIMCRVKQFRALIAITVGAAIVSLIAREMFMRHAVSHISYYYHSLSHLDPFALGCLSSLLYFQTERFGQWVNQYAAWVTLAGLMLWISLVLFLPSIFENRHSNLWMISLVAISWSMVVLGVMNWRRIQGVLSFPLLVHCGKLTYGMYAYHYLCIYLSTRWTGFQYGQASLKEWLIEGLIALLLTYVFARLSWKILEHPAISMRRRFTRVRSGLDDERDGTRRADG